MLNSLQWLALAPKRAQIEAALQALGVPLTGWMNEVPTFREPYEPDWEEIGNIATTVNTKGVGQWKKPEKVPEKAKAPKKVVKGVANGSKSKR